MAQRGLIERGNIDLYAQPEVRNPDGTHSTVDSVGVNIDGKEYLLPTVTPDGRHFTGPSAADQATAEFKKTGRHLGVFADVPSSNAYGEQLHADYEAGKYKRGSMPEKVIDIPGYGPTAFPDSMSDADIETAAAKLYKDKNPGHPPPDPKHSWVDTAIDWLPTVGGVVGGVAGGMVGGPLGAAAGAALGGAGGEGYRQTIKAAQGQPVTTSELGAAGRMAGQAAVQGASEVGGALIGRGMAKAAPALMNSALKVTGQAAKSAAVKGQVPQAVKTLLDEGVNVTPNGMEKLNRLLTATNQEIKDTIASVTGDVNPFKVTAKLGDVAKTFGEQVNPEADLRAVGKAGNEFLRNNPKLTIQEAQALKTGTYRQLAGKYGELKGAEVESQKALARGLKDEIADEVSNSIQGLKGRLGMQGGADITALNAREGTILEAREALGKRLAVSTRQNPMGLASLAVSHPMTFLTALVDRSPAVKSLLARGLYTTAGAVGNVSPQLIKAAVAAIASSSDTPSEAPQ